MSDPQMKIRLSPPLKEWVERSAQANNRSMTAEISFRLEKARQAESRDGDGANVSA